MRGGALGDFVLTLPVLQALRATHPEAFLTLMARPQYARLAAPDRIIDLHDSRLAPLHADGGRLDSELLERLAELDLLIVFTTTPEGPLVEHLQRIVQGQVIAADPRPAPHTSTHITEHLLAPLRGLGIHAATPVPRIRIDAQARRTAEQEHRHHRRPLVMIHPGSGGRKKCWPDDRFARLAEQLRRRGCGVLTLAGPVETHVNQTNREPMVRPPDPVALAGCLSQADLFIGNDAGPGHVAAAVGIPTLTLFGPTRPEIWRPRGPQAHIIRAQAGELTRLGVDSVVQAAAYILRKSSP